MTDHVAYPGCYCADCVEGPPSARIMGDKDRGNSVEGAPPHTPMGAALIYAQKRIEALEAENERLREALVQHNDRLRSAAAVAAREGRETNWLSFRGQVRYTLAEYHELVSEARTALERIDNGDR